MVIDENLSSQVNFEFYKKQGDLLSKIFLALNRLEVSGQKNEIEKGPNIIVANHKGAAKDIVLIYKIFERQIFFCAADYIFSAEDFRKEIKNGYLKKLFQGKYKLLKKPFVTLLNPVINHFAEYISSRIQKVGTIPIPIWTKKYSNSIDTIKEYLSKNRAIALLQANIKSKSKFNPYMSRFRKGVAKIAQDLYLDKGLELPVTPVSIYGATGLITPFKKISVNIGEHMTIGPYMDARNPVAEFTDALERRVAELLSVNEYGVRSKE